MRQTGGISAAEGTSAARRTVAANTAATRISTMEAAQRPARLWRRRRSRWSVRAVRLCPPSSSPLRVGRAIIIGVPTDTNEP